MSFFGGGEFVGFVEGTVAVRVPALLEVLCGVTGAAPPCRLWLFGGPGLSGCVNAVFPAAMRAWSLDGEPA